MNTAIIAIIGLIVVLGIIVVMMRGKKGADQQTPPATKPISQQPNTPVPQPATKPQQAPQSMATGSATTVASSGAMTSMTEPSAVDESAAMTESAPSFDDLESELILGEDDQVNTQTESAPTDSLSLDDDALNFADFEESLDANDTSSDTSSEQPTSQPPAEDELTFDDFNDGLSLDDSTTDSSAGDLEAGLNETSEDSSEDNVLDLSDSFADPQTETQASEPALDNDSNEFDLSDMMLEDDTADAPVSDSDALVLDDASEEADAQELSFEDTTFDATSDTPAPLEADDSTALESASLDIKPQTQEVVLEEAGELDMSDMALSSEDSTDVQDDVENDVQASDDTFAQLDAITQSEIDDSAQSDQELLTESPQTPTDTVELSEEPSDSAELTDLSDQGVEEAADDAPSSEPMADISAAPVVDDAEFMQAFDFVQDLDGTQVTLDLAQQYLELGEYDSAKRLVNEVLSGQGSDAQKTAAQSMLDNMS